MTYTIPVIATPAGKCPVKLKSSEYEDVIEWSEKVLSQGRTNNVNYLPSALIFFSQQFFSIFTPEHKIIKNHIQDHYGMAGDIQEVINRVNLNPIQQKPATDENGDVVKKRRGRPPKKQYSVSELMSKEVKEDVEPKKVKLRRK
jgi:hypothetical protein